MTDLWGSNPDDVRVQRQDDVVAERDPAGELGTIEPYWDDVPSSTPMPSYVADLWTSKPELAYLLARDSAPDYAPDMHGYIRLAYIFGGAAIIIGLPLIGFLAGYIVRSVQ